MLGRMETTRSRVRKVLAGQRPLDRLPVIEWASWWHLTINRWQEEGLPVGLSGTEAKRFLGLDVDHQLWIHPAGMAVPQYEDGRWIVDEHDYDRIRPDLYPYQPYDARAWAELDQKDELTWITLEGFFWWPRTLFGIEEHLYAFYDQPQLMHRINRDLCTYWLNLLNDLPFCPDFMTFAEDMSYNHGPMLSKDLFDEFLAPYYRELIPELKKRGIAVLIDSDGDVTDMIPWLQEVGFDGVLPLERRAGVDVGRIQREFPSFRLIGGFDKTVMHLGEGAMRDEFERLLPAMRQGGYVPSVDHQTPPDVSLQLYEKYVSLLHEYAAKACA